MSQMHFEDPFASSSVWAEVSTPATAARASQTSLAEAEQPSSADAAAADPHKQPDANDAAEQFVSNAMKSLSVSHDPAQRTEISVADQPDNAASIAAGADAPQTQQTVSSFATNAANVSVAAAANLQQQSRQHLRSQQHAQRPQQRPQAPVIPNPLIDDPLLGAANPFERQQSASSDPDPAIAAPEISAFDPLSTAPSASDPSHPNRTTINEPIPITFDSNTDETTTHSQTHVDTASTRPIPPSETSMSSDNDNDDASQPTKQTNFVVHDPLLSPHHDESTNSHADDSEQLAAMQSVNLNAPNTIKPMYHFEVQVTEPTKIGEALSSHISYKIRTKTDFPEYRNPEFAVNRRFRDFLWLYNQLIARYPGVIVPPVPEKHAIGRFQEEFIETRRVALERFIRKITSHPILQTDSDVRMFLESETFSSDKKSDRKTGFMGAFGESTPQVYQTFPKVPDNEPTLESRRQQAENLDTQLKALSKSLDLLMRQRRELGQAILEMGDSLIHLANAETHPELSRKLIRLGNIHKRIRDLQEKQAREDLQHVYAAVDEHIRVIGSIKIAYASRSKMYAAVQSAETNFNRRSDALNKMEASSRVRTDKLAVLRSELNEAETQVEETSKAFQKTTQTLIRELDRIDLEKTADFTNAMKLFLSSLMDTQMQIIEAWQSYFLPPQDDEQKQEQNSVESPAENAAADSIAFSNSN